MPRAHTKEGECGRASERAAPGKVILGVALRTAILRLFEGSRLLLGAPSHIIYLSCVVCYLSLHTLI